MKLLLTNDDGIDAPGLRALTEAVIGLGAVTVVAPVDGLSGCSHRVTTHKPFRVERRGEDRFAVDGTPADCVRVALHRLHPEPTWVLSGINAGGNLGADIYVSGTVAAVREGVLHGWPGIALSQYHRRGVPIDWEMAARLVTPVVRDILAQPWERGTFWNINLPHLDSGDPSPPVVVCPLDPGPLPLSYREEGEHFHYDGNYHGRSREAGCDVDVCFGGKIAVTRLRLG